jgi:hypothetical protein
MRNGTIIISGESGGMWEEIAVAYFNILPPNSQEGLSDTKNNFGTTAHRAEFEPGISRMRCVFNIYLTKCVI